MNNSNRFMSLLVSSMVGLCASLLAYSLIYNQLSALRAGLISAGIFYLFSISFFIYINKSLHQLLRTLPVPNRIIYFLLAVAAGAIFTARQFQNLPTNDLIFPGRELMIATTPTSNPSSGGNQIELLWLHTEYGEESFSSFKQVSGSWDRVGGALSIDAAQGPGVLTWKGAVGSDLVVVFKTSPQSGIVSVLFNSQEKLIDLYSDLEGEYAFRASFPIQFGDKFVFAIPLILLSALCVFILLVYFNRFQSVLDESSGQIPHLLAITAIAILSSLVFYKALQVAPFYFDTLLGLTAGYQPNPWMYFFGRTISHSPFYRPVAYSSIWLQYQLFNLNISTYYFFNSTLWVLGCVVFYLILNRIIKNRLASLLFTLLFLLDSRVYTMIVWIVERQMSFVVFFGAAAWYLAIDQKEKKGHFAKAVLVGLLLLLASLSKEYAFAFNAAILVWIFLNNPSGKTRMTAAVVIPMLIYISMRLFFGGASSMSLFDFPCEDMGFFSELRLVCYNNLSDVDVIVQQVYNVGATFLSSIFPSLFSVTGVFGLDILRTRELMFDLVLFSLALLAWIKLPKATLPGLALIAANAVLNFMIFRERNQIVGMMGLYLAAAVGMNVVLQHARNRLGSWKLVSQLIILLALIFVYSRGVELRERITTYANWSIHIPICEQAARPGFEEIEPQLLTDLIDLYELDTSCE